MSSPQAPRALLNVGTTDQGTFSMPWSIPDEQWERARAAGSEHPRGSRYDRDGLGRYYLLYGDVDFAFATAHLYRDAYGEAGVNISLFDFVVAVADAYLEQGFSSGARVTYEQLDDDRHIWFAGEIEGVRITASDCQAAVFVPWPAFMQGLRTFLCSFGNALKHRAADILAWESMEPLRDVMAKHCGN